MKGKMSKKKKTLVDKAIESGNPMALGLALVEGNIRNANKLNESIRDADRVKIKELQARVEELEEYIRRTKNRINKFFFGSDEPVYEDEFYFMDKSEELK